MRILMVCSSLYPCSDANSDIALRIAAEMKARGHVVKLLSRTETYTEQNQIERKSIPIELMVPRWTKFRQGLPSGADKKEKFRFYAGAALRHPIGAASFLRNVNQKTALYQQAAQICKALEKNCAKEQWDAILAQCQPFSAWYGAAKAKVDVPLYLHQMDPYAANDALLPFEKNKLQELENIPLARAKHIFTTYLLKAEGENGELAGVQKKTSVVEFPCVRKPGPEGNKQNFFGTEKTINLLFAGTLDDAYRSPAYLLEVFLRAAQKEPRLQLFFMGTMHSDVLADAAKGRKNLHFLGNRSAAEAQAAMLQADMLVNIGNTMPNMMPSKILNYISTGKPILNICKMAQCPTRRLTARYPLALDLEEGESPEQSAEKMLEFVRKTQGQQLPFEKVEAMFEDCTPRYVADQILAVMQQETKHEKDTI